MAINTTSALEGRVEDKEASGEVEAYLKEFLSLRQTSSHIYAIERAVQLLIQSILDKGYALILFRLRGFRLSELSSLAGFRDILVHGYAVINEETT